MVFLDAAGVFTGVMDASQTSLDVESLGANPDCSTDLVEGWEVAVVNDSGSTEPQIIEFNAGTVARVRMVIVEEPGEH